MPFDSTGFAPGTAPTQAADPIALYRKRREDAAALWRDVPRERFDIETWHMETSCGTVACALGWLAAREHDDWRLDQEHKVLPEWGQYGSYAAGAAYFGLDIWDAKECFGFDTHANYGCNSRAVTGAMVADKLLVQPYYVPGA